LQRIVLLKNDAHVLQQHIASLYVSNAVLMAAAANGRGTADNLRSNLDVRIERFDRGA